MPNFRNVIPLERRNLMRDLQVLSRMRMSVILATVDRDHSDKIIEAIDKLTTLVLELRDSLPSDSAAEEE